MFSIACLALASPARAILIIGPEDQIPVAEFFNSITGHYFLTADLQEAVDIDAGSAGPGWVRTGLLFFAYPRCGTHDAGCRELSQRPVMRFYGPGPNTHVFTADPEEAALLRRPGSGWIFEGEAFRVFVPAPSGACEAGLTPLVRLYNDRFAFNDSNHRYVWREEERARMRAKGWIDEGTRFCIPAAREVPLRSFEHAGWPTILPSAVCEDEAVNLGPCVAVNNLTPPSVRLPASSPFDAFYERTGARSLDNFVQPGQPAEGSAERAFVQNSFDGLGIHVSTAGRGTSMFSSINPLYQLRTQVEGDGRDRRFFPWATAYDVEVQLSVAGVVNVKRLRVNASSHAYGHPTLEFIDQRSGRHLYFTALAYGTPDPALDYLAPDTATGKVIVGTAFRAGTPYGRHAGFAAVHLPRDFVAGSTSGVGGAFDFRIDRGEFQRIVDAARTVDAALSPNVADYMVDNFHFNNEVVGDGEIGLNLAEFRLQLLRR